MKTTELLECAEHLSEGINDPNIFKAIFMAGGPGSGKSTIANLMFGIDRDLVKSKRGPINYSSLGLKFASSDEILERLAKVKGISLDMLRELSQEQQLNREHAKRLTNMRRAGWINGMLGLVVDGTARDFAKIKKSRDYLEMIGYDTGMVFVNTSLDVALEANRRRERSVPEDVVRKSWDAVQQNMGKFQKLFGKRNFLIVDNSARLSGDQFKELGDRISQEARRWLSKPLANPIGVSIVNFLRSTGGKTLSDIPKGFEARRV